MLGAAFDWGEVVVKDTAGVIFIGAAVEVVGTGGSVGAVTGVFVVMGAGVVLLKMFNRLLFASLYAFAASLNLFVSFAICCWVSITLLLMVVKFEVTWFRFISAFVKFAVALSYSIFALSYSSLASAK